MEELVRGAVCPNMASGDECLRILNPLDSYEASFRFSLEEDDKVGRTRGACRHVKGGRRVLTDKEAECVPKVAGGGVCISKPTTVAAEESRSEKQEIGAVAQKAKADAAQAEAEAKPEAAQAEAARSITEAEGKGMGAQSTPDESSDVASPEHIAMLRRLGLNRAEVIGVLRDKMVGSIDSRAPMRVIKYKVFKEFGRIPRSSDKKTVLLSEVPDDAKLGFTSHRWFRPWQTKEECEKNGHEWEVDMPHPDDSKATKHKLICDGMEKLAESKEWDLDKVYLWIDFAGVEQDDEKLLKAGVASLRGYITLCDAVLIPASEVPDEGAHNIDAVPGGYGERGWTRLEAMSMYAVSVLKQVEAPEIWVAAGDGAHFLERFDYVLRELPSAGVLFSEADREYIKGHEEAFLREMKESVRRNGYITKHQGCTRCVTFDPKDKDGNLVASGGDDGVVKLVNRQTGTVAWALETKRKVRSLAFNGDGSMLAAGRDDGVVQIWTVAAGSTPVEKCSLTGHSNVVYSVAFSPDSKTLASGSADGTVKLWDLSGDAPVEKGTLRGHSDCVSCVAWNHDGSLLASSSEDMTVKLWDLTTVEEKGTLRGHTGTPESSLQALAAIHAHFNMDVAEAYEYWDKDEDGVVSLEDLEKTLSGGELNTGLSGEQIRELHEHLVHLGSCDGGGVTKDAWVEAVSAAASSDVVYDPTDPRLKCTLKGHSGSVLSVAFSPDSKALASASGDKTVKLWDLSGDAPVEKGTLKGHSSIVWSVAFSPDSKTLASSGDNTVKLWDLSSGTPTEKGTLTGHSNDVKCVAWNHDGSLLASSSDDRTVKLWDFRTMEEKGTLTGHSSSVWSVAFSPDSKTLASASQDNTVKLWDLSGDAPVEKGTLTGHSDVVYSVAFSPDSKTLASASQDKTVMLWDLSGDAPVEKGTLKGHSDWVLSVAFSPDSKTLASASFDETVKLWDLSGDVPVEKGTLTGHSNVVFSVAFSPDGKTLASGSRDKTVKLWDLSGGSAVEKGTLKGTVASWQNLDPETKALAAKVKAGGSSESERTGQYIVTANSDMVYVHKTNADGEEQGEPLACFRSPTSVMSVSCRGTKVVVGCEDGQVLFLEAPLLAVG